LRAFRAAPIGHAGAHPHGLLHKPDRGIREAIALHSFAPDMAIRQPTVPNNLALKRDLRANP
jgi:hypothetical protein